MSNPLSGWRIISRKDLREMARPVPYSQSTEKRVKDAKFEYWNIYKNCTSEVQKRKELERVSEKYNIREDIILEFVDRQLKYRR